MKRFFTAVILAAACALSVSGQTTKEEYLRRYTNLVDRVGAAGVGVETLLDKWEADFPEDDQQLLARFAFCFARCQSSRVIQLPKDRYLGKAPILPMTDSLGNKCNYFEDTLYDDELYALANSAIDKAIALKNWKLDYRFLKLNAMLAYEKESPDMTLQQLKALVDEHYTKHPAWTYEGVEKVGDERRHFPHRLRRFGRSLQSPVGTSAALQQEQPAFPEQYRLLLPGKKGIQESRQAIRRRAQEAPGRPNGHPQRNAPGPLHERYQAGKEVLDFNGQIRGDGAGPPECPDKAGGHEPQIR